MLLNHVLLAVMWVIYCGLHSVLASLPVKSFFQKRLGPAFKHYRLAYTVFAFAGLIALLLFQFSVATAILYTPTFLILLTGSVAGLSGLIIMAVCIKKYFLNLSGLRSLAREELHTVLEVRGIHRYVRHPLYLGTFLFLWGLFVLFPAASLLLSNGIVTVYTLLALKWEERKLVLQFGEVYKIYQQKVPPIIPKF